MYKFINDEILNGFLYFIASGFTTICSMIVGFYLNDKEDKKIKMLTVENDENKKMLLKKELELKKCKILSKNNTSYNNENYNDFSYSNPLIGEKIESKRRVKKR